MPASFDYGNIISAQGGRGPYTPRLGNIAFQGGSDLGAALGAQAVKNSGDRDTAGIMAYNRGVEAAIAAGAQLRDTATRTFGGVGMNRENNEAMLANARMGYEAESDLYAEENSPWGSLLGLGASLAFGRPKPIQAPTPTVVPAPTLYAPVPITAPAAKAS